jgi:hypothetical protein
MSKQISTQWLGFAAAPTFAAMGLLTVLCGDGDPMCTMAHTGSVLSSMGAMYLTMAAFHLGPWLRLLPPLQRT